MNMEDKYIYHINAINNSIKEIHDLYKIMDTVFIINNMDLLKKFKLLKHIECSSRYVLAKLKIATSKYDIGLVNSKKYSKNVSRAAYLIGLIRKAYIEGLIEAERGLYAQVEFDIKQMEARLSGDKYFSGVSANPKWMAQYNEGRKVIYQVLEDIKEAYDYIFNIEQIEALLTEDKNFSGVSANRIWMVKYKQRRKDIHQALENIKDIYGWIKE